MKTPRPLPFACRARWIAACAIALTHGVSAADLQGITEPYLDATLSAPVAGILGKQFFKEGDRVEAGKVIVELDKRIEELEVSRREVQVEYAQDVTLYQVDIQTGQSRAAGQKITLAEDVLLLSYEHTVSVAQRDRF